MGLEMAGKTRHLKEKDGRFYARIAVSGALRSATGSASTAPDARIGRWT